MEKRAIVKHSKKNRNITVTVIPGHFATSHSHINYFVDLTNLKSMYKMAKAGAEQFALIYENTPIDTILCFERTKMVAAFLAEALSARGINQGQDIAVLTPEQSNGQIILRDNVQSLVWGKNVLNLFANVSTGLTAASAVRGIRYYGGNPIGVAALFATQREIEGLEIRSIFSEEEVEGYETHNMADCPLCKARVKLDALVNSYGYSKL